MPRSSILVKQETKAHRNGLEVHQVRTFRKYAAELIMAFLTMLVPTKPVGTPDSFGQAHFHMSSLSGPSKKREHDLGKYSQSVAIKDSGAWLPDFLCDTFNMISEFLSKVRVRC